MDHEETWPSTFIGIAMSASFLLEKTEMVSGRLLRSPPRANSHLVRQSWIIGLATLALIYFSPIVVAATIAKKLVPDTDVTLLAISGTITAEDQETFGTDIEGLSNVIVALDSPGGNLIAGLEIGKKIRMRNFATLVVDGSHCTSVCALIWLGGTRRFLEPGAAVGFHAAYVFQNGTAAESGVGNALVGAYLTNLGLEENAVIYITQASPNKITWLDEKSAMGLGIRFNMLSDNLPERSLAPAPASAPPPENSPLSARAAGFMKYYWENVSDANEFALYYLKSTYAPVVRYYGKDVPRDTILAEKERWIKRWPNRKTTPRKDTVHVNCDEAVAECEITGIGDYDVKSEARSAHATGRFRYWFMVRFSRGLAQILLENSEVIQRS
jgi:hypothetical protein